MTTASISAALYDFHAIALAIRFATNGLSPRLAGKIRPMKKITPPAAPEIRAGQSLELLKALHILTRDGQLNQDSRRKLKQVLVTSCGVENSRCSSLNLE